MDIDMDGVASEVAFILIYICILTLMGLYRLRCRVVFVVDICGHVYALVFFGLSLVQSKRGRIGPGASGVGSLCFGREKKKEKFRGVLHYV